MSREKIIRRNTNKKKRQRVIAASITAILLGTVATGAGIFLQKNNTTSNTPSTPEVDRKDILISKIMLDEININDIQKKVIDSNEIEYGQQNLFNSKLKSFVSTALNNLNEIKVNTFKKDENLFLRITLDEQKGKQYQFCFENITEIDAKKYTISEDRKYIEILLSENDGKQDFQFFNSYSITNVQKAYNALVDEINKNEHRYTLDEFKLNFSKCVKIFTSNLAGLDTSLIKQTNFKEQNKSIEIELDNEYKKYNLEPTEFVSFNKANATITISNLKFYDEVQLNINNEFKLNLQKFIDNDNRRYTKEEMQIHANELKNIIIANIPEIKHESWINEISLNNNDISFSLGTNQKIKFNVNSKPTTVNYEEKLVNGNLVPTFTVSGLEYFTLYQIANTSKGYEALNKEINKFANRYTDKEFKNNLKSIIPTFFNELTLNDNKFDQNIATTTFDESTSLVNIQLRHDRKKYQVETDKNISFNDMNSIITIKNLKFYENSIININKNLKTLSQEFIDDPKRQLTALEFSSETNTHELKNEIAKQMGINYQQIGNFEIRNNDLVFVLKPLDNDTLKKYEIQGIKDDILIKDIQLENGFWTYEFTIQGLTYFTAYEITNTNKAIEALNKEITKTTNRYTVEQFEEKFNDATTKENIMNQIYDNLKLNNGEESIGFIKDNVTSTFDKNNREIRITLNTKHKKYTITNENEQVVLNDLNNTLIIKNIDFYSNVNIDVKSEFRQNIQNYIEEQDRRYTNTEFEAQTIAGDQALKNKINDSLGVNDENILSMHLVNDELYIELAKANYKKYIITNAKLPDGITYEDVSDQIQNPFFKISGLNFYTQYNIENVETGYTTLMNKISNPENRYTIDEFKTNIDNCLDAFYSKLENFNKTFVTSYNKDNLPTNITINLSTEGLKKYSMQNIDGVSLDSSTSIMTITGFEFYTTHEVTVSNNLKTNIQNFIEQPDKKYTVTEFLDEDQNIIKEKITQSISGITSDQIEKIDVKNRTELVITLKNLPNLSKYTFVNNDNNVSTQYVEIDGQYKQQIIISNLQFYRINGYFLYTDSQLLKMWKLANQTILDNDIRSSSINPSIFASKKQILIDTLCDFPADNGVPLREFIYDIPNNFILDETNLRINFKQELPPESNPEDPFLKFPSRDIDEGYIQASIDDVTVRLNNLWIGNPDDYFVWNNDQTEIKSLSQLGTKEPNILISPKASRIASNSLRGLNINKLIICDSVREIDEYAVYDTELSYLRLSRNIVEVKNSTFGGGGKTKQIQEIKMYNGLKVIGYNSFINSALPDLLTLPTTVSEISQGAFAYPGPAQNPRTLFAFRTDANKFSNNILMLQLELRYLELFYEGVYNPNDLDGAAFNGLNVSSVTILNKDNKPILESKYPFFRGKIVVEQNNKK